MVTLTLMKPARKITVHVPEDLLEKARRSTGRGITETVRQGLRLVAASETYASLRELRGKMAAYLSGGQQQMLAIGRGVMSRPRLLMLDEPSLGLSPLLIQEIFAIIARLNREQGMTILLVEQNANVALQVSNRGYVMEVGGIVMDGKSADLLESEDIKEFYLGKKEEGVRGRRRWKKRKTWR